MDRLREQYQERINSVLLDGFEKELLDAAFVNLLTPNSLRLNNFAYALRELTRHVLHRLAPDDELQQCQWFSPDKTSTTGVTRKHRIKFAIQGGLSDYYVTNKLWIDGIDEVSSELIAIVNRLSGFTHIEEATFKSPIEDIERTADECLSATLDFVNKIDEMRTEVADKLLDDIDSVLLDRINSESVVELMEISTHQYIEEISAEEISVVKIGVNSIEM